MSTPRQPDAVQSVLTDHPGRGVIVLTLNRPEVLNALDHNMVQALQTELDAAERDPDCRVVILTGRGRGFCVGLDLRGYGDDEGHHEISGPVRADFARQRELSGLVERLRRLRVPVVAAINGPVAGGGLALACASDVRIAARGAVFAVAFISAGYSSCDMGLSWTLPRIVGAGRAHELMLTGRQFDADEACRIGLVTEVVDDAGSVRDAALRTAELIVGHAAFAVELTKAGMWAAMEGTSLSSVIAFEDRQQVLAGITEDAAEAAQAFLEKRSPTSASASGTQRG